MRMMMPLISRRISALLALLVFVFTSVPDGNVQAQIAGGKVKATIGAWQISCGKPAGSKVEKCAAVQSVTAEDRPNVGLTVIFQKSLSDNKQMLLVVAPLGVLLPTGLGLIIDGKDVGRVPFLRCGKIGCFAEAVVPDTLTKKFQSGKTALFTIFQTPEEGIAIPIALDGFNKALQNIK
jgi:invasion protein IalB